ncbi:hypothetical protein [Curtobacterium pusillum]|uniref:hypothetical protein n=1 Tax=Curtobacterium pusillum TaxID=69373 RepID=UPI0011A44F9F|nr:hypothetical protein [Curtobacterium pusillum]
MQIVTDHVRWVASDADDQPLLAWAADRATAVGRHLAPVTAIGRLPGGRLAVDVQRPIGTPLATALDTLGTPTTGVAVTLTVPLLELAAAERSGSVRIGTAGLDDVLVDDAGAVVLCDRPPGTDGVRGADEDGARVLLLAARVVWERADPRDPVRPLVDDAIAEALDGGAEAVRAALSHVRAAAAPRPVRWEPAAHELIVGVPPDATEPADGFVAVARRFVEHGVPFGSDRRLPFRRALVGAVVAAGVTTAAVFTLG